MHAVSTSTGGLNIVLGYLPEYDNLETTIEGEKVGVMDAVESEIESSLLKNIESWSFCFLILCGEYFESLFPIFILAIFFFCNQVLNTISDYFKKIVRKMRKDILKHIHKKTK